MTQIPRSSVILPLYIYPNPGAWEPLYAAVAKYPSLSFIVILNPHSGPGSPPWWPNADYVREIPRLNAQPNVQTVGYVRTTYCQRPISDVYTDIDTYAKWSGESDRSGLGVKGIFFDETPNLYSEAVKSYLDAMTQRVKDSLGVLGDKLVIHNPGTAVEAQLADPGLDITMVVEETFSKFQGREYQQWISTSPYDRMQTSFVVHSVPADAVSGLTRELRKRAGYVFITDLDVNYYHSFGSSWATFLAAMTEE